MRRRPRRRPVRPIGGRHQIGDGPRRQLQLAHRLMENGSHDRASVIFENLARGAHDRGMVRHAPNLYLQAARANILGGSVESGKKLIYQALGILKNTQRWPALARMGQRVVDELQQLGHEDAAIEVSDWVKQTLPDSIESYAQPSKNRSPSLPLKCPFCGGVLRPGEVEMLDQITGECPYCGSAVRGDA
jgi:hypothetical protein